MKNANLRNTKGEILKNVHAALFHTMKYTVSKDILYIYIYMMTEFTVVWNCCLCRCVMLN